ncbi:MAG: FAD-dependent oxidoreductase [Nitriliruptor sp.]|nr:MAG: FAD-dependent oxidoreductase [Nitriliruptor sp.]
MTETLLSPLTIASTRVRNRSVFTAHGAFLDFYRPGESPERYIAYQERRARGGNALAILQPVHVHPTSHGLGHFTYDADDLGEKLALTAERLHRHDTKVMIQLMHWGAEFVSDARRDLEPIWAFSEVVTPTGGEVTHAMTSDEIEEVIAGFVDTARIAVAAGLDGVEIHAAHGYLVQQSFSPFANRRDDKWGEPLRFITTLVERIRAAIGNEAVLGARFSVDDFVPPERGGLGPAGIREVITEVVGGGGLDLVNTSAGSRASHYARAVGGYHHPKGMFLPLVARIREAIDAAVPVIGTGRITTPELAEQALTDGACDLVALTRAQIADPDFVAKAAGANTPIRPCVGANQGCVDRMVGALAITCFHNPDVGREAWQGELGTTSEPRHVVVVGGGPAGLKAAETAARRGHRVTLLERSHELGGRLLLSTRFGAAAELGGAIDWLEEQLPALGVEVRTGVTADEALIRSLDADRVVLATGSQANDDHIRGDGSVPVWTTDRALTDDPGGKRVLVVDQLGTHEAAQAAERLAALGNQVHVVTPMPAFGEKIGFTQLRGQLDRLLDHDCRIDASALVTDVTEGFVTIRHARAGRQEDCAVDVIVAAVARRAVVDLRDPLTEAGLDVRVAGDATAPRTAMHAFREGADAGRSID